MPAGGVDLTIVVVSFSRPDILARSLHAIVAQHERSRHEIVVIRRRSDELVPALRARYPDVRWVDADPVDDVPRMRERAIRLAEGRVIALLEDDCLIGEAWCRGVAAAHGNGHAVIGGAIEPDRYTSAVDWAVFFCEYARFAAPFCGEVTALPGNNVSYARPALLEWLAGAGDRGFYDVFAHAAWRARGIRLVADERLTVQNVNRWTAATLTRVPFHHGRNFAAQRVAGRSARRLAARLGLAALTPLLPAVKTARVVREVVRRGRWRRELLRAFPGIVLFNTSWACGECLGYLCGAGSSRGQWR